MNWARKRQVTSLRSLPAGSSTAGIQKTAVNGVLSLFQGPATGREKDQDSWTVALLGRQILTMNAETTLKKAIAETMA